MLVGKKPVILLVEDSADDVELIKISLSSQFAYFNLHIVSDGEEALNYLYRSENVLPDLILLDLHMPKLGGLEVLKELRENERTTKLPVIIFTSSQEQEDLEKSYQLGANAFIRKSLEPAEFMAALKHLDVYWMLKSE